MKARYVVGNIFFHRKTTAHLEFAFLSARWRNGWETTQSQLVWVFPQLDAISGGGELADSEGPIQADACRPLCCLLILHLHLVFKSFHLLLFINLHQHLPPRPAPSEHPSCPMDHCSCVPQSGDPTSNLAKPTLPAKNFPWVTKSSNKVLMGGVKYC